MLDMMQELYDDFELILYTCGTKSYAQAFSEAVHKAYFEKFHKGNTEISIKNFNLFDHVLSLQQCLYSYENDLYIKDLKILEIGRSLTDIVIVDNNV